MQKMTDPSSNAKFTRIFNASSSSTHIQIVRSIEPKYTQYLATTGDASKFMQSLPIGCSRVESIWQI